MFRRVSKMKITKVQELTYELKVSDAMSKNVIFVTPKTWISELREVLRINRISGVPVVENDKLVGVVSIEDFIKCLAEGDVDIPVGDKMTKDIKIVYSDEPLISCVNKFEGFGFGRFPVINRNSGNLVGIITKGDIISALLKELEIDYHEEEIKKFRASHVFEDITSDRTTLILEHEVRGGDFKNAGESSSRLKRNLTRLGISPDIIRRVAIAVLEAEMNIVIFTPGGKITAFIEPDKIRITAVDPEPGIEDIELALKPGFSTAPAFIRELGFGAGMGLPNIKKCADSLNISSKLGEGTNLEFIVHIN